MKNVFITGISGYIGSKIARALSAHGGVDRIVGIDIREPSIVEDKVLFIRQDVRKPVLDILKTHGIDTVIHAAYVLPPGHDTRRIEDINVMGTKNILAYAAQAGVSRLLYTSSTTAYGFHPDNDNPLTEESPLRGNDDFTYSKNKKEIEGLFTAFVEANKGICVTVLRPCYVAGPGLDNPLSTHLKKKIVLLPGKTSPFQFVHEDDLVRIMVLCLEKNLAGIFNVAGQGTISFEQMVRTLGNIPVFLPDAMVGLLNGIAWHLRLTFFTQFPNSGLNLIRHPWIATSRKLIRETGFAFEYDSTQAFEDFAAHLMNTKGKKTILITGAASGIGRATALYFASRNWFVGLFDLNLEGLEGLHAEIGADNSCFKQMDVTSHASVAACVNFMAEKTGNRLDLLFNCAGVLFMGPHASIDIAAQKKTLDVNICGCLNCIDACLPLLKETRDAAIINMSSASAVYGTPELAVYSASKHAVRGLTEALNIELEPHGIHVCDIMAPYVRTPMILAASRRATSVDRLRVSITPEEVAGVVFQAQGRKKVHWHVGGLLKLLVAGATLLPFARRFLVKTLAFSNKQCPMAENQLTK